MKRSEIIRESYRRSGIAAREGQTLRLGRNGPEVIDNASLPQESTMTTFSGPAGVATYRAVALKSGLALYAKTGMRPNRSWTPTAMLRAASQITGTPYKRGQYAQAIADLTVWLDTNGTTGQ